MNRLISAAVVMIALVGCESTPVVNTDFNPAANFSGYRTFAFISEHPMIMAQTQGPVSPLLETRIMTSIRSTLGAKGLRYVERPEQADITVSFTVGSRREIRVDSYPTAYRGGWGGWGWGRTYYQDVQVRDYTKGQLAIDLFDVKTRAPVWHGVATQTITQGDRETPAEFLNGIVSSLFTDYPPS